MAVVMKTPGVYIIEKNAFPNSVVEVATAVPAFIGYTERADDKGRSLNLVPKRLTSLAEYHGYFGAAPVPTFDIVSENVTAEDADFQQQAAADQPATHYKLVQKSGRYFLYQGMKHFFQNGGGPCYVVSVGSYSSQLSPKDLTAGIDALVKEPEPTMLVAPDCVLLDEDADSGKCITVQQAMLQQCGRLRNRFAILDIWSGWKKKEDCIADFRDNLGVNDLDFGAAYYPWLNSTIVLESDLGYRNFTDAGKALLKQVLSATVARDNSAALNEVGKITWGPDDWKKAAAERAASKPADPNAPPAAEGAVDEKTQAWIDTSKEMVDQTLLALSPLYKTILSAMRKRLNLIPPSAAMAGIYTMVDNTRGVWKAPANVSLNSVVSPAVNLSKEEQEDLNVTPQGKSINAIRAFVGEGVLVWGARTLNGNSLDWRYINVRRTMIMLEESCRLAAKAMVFEPNVSSTWVTIKSMIENFLTSVWKRGGLAGAVPADAFSVHVGLGETMTPEDILEGILRVTVLVAVSRPAEFIEITFQQQMQKS